MSGTESVKNAIAKKQDNPIAQLQAMAPQFKMVLGSDQRVNRFMRVTQTAISLNPELLTAERRSLFGACMKAAQDGLEPDGRKAAMTIRKTKNGPVVVYMPMVEGLIDKLYATGSVSSVSIHVVHENDEFEYALGDNEHITHKPALIERGAMIGAYSIVRFKDGAISREWMSKTEIDGIRGRSMAKDFGPWQTDYPEMAKKTVFRRHYKRLPKISDELDDLIRHDDAAQFSEAPEYHEPEMVVEGTVTSQPEEDKS